jgi:hypothetical protein
MLNVKKGYESSHTKEDVMEVSQAMRAEEYYKLVGGKNVEGIKKYLHPDVELYSPLATVKGRQAVVQATSNFMNAFKTLTIRARFGAGDQAMIVYNTNIPGIAEEFPGASLLTFREGMIIKIELFYDGSRFMEKKAEIFSRE